MYKKLKYASRNQFIQKSDIGLSNIITILFNNDVCFFKYTSLE
jgi:hypothetical protein